MHKPNKKIGYYGNVVAAPVVKKIAEAVIHDIPKNTILNLNSIATLAVEKEELNDFDDVTLNRIPDVRGWPAMEAVAILENLGIEVKLKGKGKVLRQSEKPGAALKKQQTIILTLS